VNVGVEVGVNVGVYVGVDVGSAVGNSVGNDDGAVGDAVGNSVGSDVGADGANVVPTTTIWKFMIDTPPGVGKPGIDSTALPIVVDNGATSAVIAFAMASKSDPSIVATTATDPALNVARTSLVAMLVISVAKLLAMASFIYPTDSLVIEP
jgi:hypothetical protein